MRHPAPKEDVVKVTRTGFHCQLLSLLGGEASTDANTLSDLDVEETRKKEKDGKELECPALSVILDACEARRVQGSRNAQFYRRKKGV